MRLQAGFFLSSIIVLVCPGAALAQYTQPFAIQNENPLVRVYNIPAQASAGTLSRGTNNFHISAVVSNYFTARQVGAEEVRLDGETHRINLRMSRGLGSGWEGGFEFSWLNRDGGVLDPVIDQWHRTFGLPRLGRDLVDEGLVDIRYSEDGSDVLRLNESGSGIGDLLLFIGKQLLGEPGGTDDGPAVTLRIQASLPTGDPGQLRGSGGAGVSSWLQGEVPFLDRWSVYGSAGASWLGEGEVLPELQRDWMMFGGIGLAWRVSEKLDVQLQLDGQGSAYEDTALEQVGSHAAQLSFGGNYEFNGGMRLGVSITENVIRTEVSPDLTLNITARSEF